MNAGRKRTKKTDRMGEGRPKTIVYFGLYGDRALIFMVDVKPPV
jgi:hypothetical protein